LNTEKLLRGYKPHRSFLGPVVLFLFSGVMRFSAKTMENPRVPSGGKGRFRYQVKTALNTVIYQRKREIP